MVCFFGELAGFRTENQFQLIENNVQRYNVQRTTRELVETCVTPLRKPL